MKNVLISSTTLLLLAALSACQSSGSRQEGADSSAMAPPIALTPVTGSPTFPDAALSIREMKAVKKGDSAILTVDFGVENYELTGQTADAAGKQCSNSAQGQHIHFILDNTPYAALYKPEHSVTLPLNSEHFLLCFLSRSYHESLKNPGAAVLRHFKIDGQGRVQTLDLPTEPMLFYSRPKGDYLGKDAENVMLDFYVYGGTLGDSLQVAATVNDTSFVIRQWQAYFIQHAPMGDLKIQLQLQHADGSALQGPYATVERTAHLAAGEPMP